MSRVTVAGLLLLALIGVACATEVAFKSGVNVTVSGTAVTDVELKEGGLGFRFMNEIALLNGVMSTSTGAFVEHSGGSFDIEVDAAFHTAAGPVAVNSRFSTDFTLPTLLGWDASSSSNIIASFPYALVEVDANKRDVMVHKIADFTWDVTTDLTTAVSAEGKLIVKMFQGTLDINGNTCTLMFSVQTSAEAGVSTYLDRDLVPKSWAFTLELKDYTLQAAENALRMQYAVATGTASLNTQGQLTCEAPEPKLQAFVDLQQTATFDGNGITVDLESFAEASFDLNSLFPTINAQMEAKYDADFKLYLCNATFEAGSNGFNHGGVSATGLRLSNAAVTSPGSDANTLHYGAGLVLASLALLGFLF